MGKKFSLITDYHRLTNYFKQPTLNAQQAHQVDFLRGFDFEIKHLKGKDNLGANALSRKANYLYEIYLSEIQNTFKE